MDIKLKSMGRNRKTGLQYFHFEVDMFQDLKIRKLIKAKGGMAITVYSLLLCMIYKQGYQLTFSDDVVFLISEQTGFDEAYVRETISACVDVGLFSKDDFDEGILTSKGVKNRYKEICILLRRKVISSEEKAINAEEIPINVTLMPINVAEMGINVAEIPISSEVITSINSSPIISSEEMPINVAEIPINAEEIKKSDVLYYINNNNIKQYKRYLLSEIKISDFPQLNEEYFNIAKAFVELFRTNLLDAGASTRNIDKARGTCIDDIRLMIETDKYTLDDLREVYLFLRKDAFWKQNIQSTSTLRKHMEKLKLKIHGEIRRSSKEGTTWIDLAQIVKDRFS